jgi:hypothetical protein
MDAPTVIMADISGSNQRLLDWICARTICAQDQPMVLTTNDQLTTVG